MQDIFGCFDFVSLLNNGGERMFWPGKQNLKERVRAAMVFFSGISSAAQRLEKSKFGQFAYIMPGKLETLRAGVIMNGPEVNEQQNSTSIAVVMDAEYMRGRDGFKALVELEAMGKRLAGRQPSDGNGTALVLEIFGSPPFDLDGFFQADHIRSTWEPTNEIFHGRNVLEDPVLRHSKRKTQSNKETKKQSINQSINQPSFVFEDRMSSNNNNNNMGRDGAGSPSVDGDGDAGGGASRGAGRGGGRGGRGGGGGGKAGKGGISASHPAMRWTGVDEEDLPENMGVLRKLEVPELPAGYTVDLFKNGGLTEAITDSQSQNEANLVTGLEVIRSYGSSGEEGRGENLLPEEAVAPNTRPEPQPFAPTVASADKPTEIEGEEEKREAGEEEEEEKAKEAEEKRIAALILHRHTVVWNHHFSGAPFFPGCGPFEIPLTLEQKRKQVPSQCMTAAVIGVRIVFDTKLTLNGPFTGSEDRVFSLSVRVKPLDRLYSWPALFQLANSWKLLLQFYSQIGQIRVQFRNSYHEGLYQGTMAAISECQGLLEQCRMERGENASQ
ncbi:hypothetical protein PspLS_11225 [Pyricularia sp. CBS 133598]|nr:hypothetical protein PspLS_11225 [Pyricularia sp. CBS 133598]